jgi:putative peptide zinc metalloprotease protein
MKEIYQELIVKKSPELEISKFDRSNDFVLTNKKLGKRIVINKDTYDIIDLIDNKRSLTEIVHIYNEKNDTTVSEEVAHTLLYKKLAKFGVVENDQVKEEIVGGKVSYLSLSFILINKQKLGFFTRLCAPILSFKFFYTILVSAFLFVLLNLSIRYNEILQYIENMPIIHWLYFALSSGIILFIHEFGHATACKKLGADPGAIGFGFYLLTPVMFADVSDIWKLKIKERIYVNLSGLYFEILVGCIFVMLFYLTAAMPFLILSLIIMVNFVINLNPFLRYDGYWVLSDITNTPNLRKVSLLKLRAFFTSLKGKTKLMFTRKTVFLILYGFLSSILIVVFLGYIILKDPNAIVSFPYDVFIFIKEFILGTSEFNKQQVLQFLLPFLFYFIAIKFVIGKLKMRLKKRKMSKQKVF